MIVKWASSRGMCADPAGRRSQPSTATLQIRAQRVIGSRSVSLKPFVDQLIAAATVTGLVIDAMRSQRVALHGHAKRRYRDSRFKLTCNNFLFSRCQTMVTAPESRPASHAFADGRLIAVEILTRFRYRPSQRRLSALIARTPSAHRSRVTAAPLHE